MLKIVAAVVIALATGAAVGLVAGREMALSHYATRLDAAGASEAQAVNRAEAAVAERDAARAESQRKSAEQSKGYEALTARLEALQKLTQVAAAPAAKPALPPPKARTFADVVAAADGLIAKLERSVAADTKDELSLMTGSNRGIAEGVLYRFEQDPSTHMVRELYRVGLRARPALEAIKHSRAGYTAGRASILESAWVKTARPDTDRPGETMWLDAQGLWLAECWRRLASGPDGGTGIHAGTVLNAVEAYLAGKPLEAMTPEAEGDFRRIIGR